MRFGKTPARHAVSWKLTDYFDPAGLPKPSGPFGHYQNISEWGDLGNFNWANCVWAGADHETMLVNKQHGFDVKFTTKNSLSDYAAVTGFNYTPQTDNGTDMKDAAAYRKSIGVIDAAGKRHTIDAYVALEVGNVDHIDLSTYLFGACGVGLMVPDSARLQFESGAPWTVVPGSRTVGGHYVSCVGRDADGYLLVVTWGKLQRVEPAFIATYSDEALAYLTLENLDKQGLSPEGFDHAALLAQLGKLA